MQNKEINKVDNNMVSQGYWYETAGKYFYKGNYVNGNSTGFFECYFVTTTGIEKHYYAR
jgi:hypothetical protein